MDQEQDHGGRDNRGKLYFQTGIFVVMVCCLLLFVNKIVYTKNTILFILLKWKLEKKPIKSPKSV